MAMSITGSMLNVASSMVAYDIVNPLRKNKPIGKQQLYLAKAACLVIRLLTVLLALYARKYGDALLRLLLLYFDISKPVIMSPFLLAVFGFGCKEKIAVLDMIVRVITIILWNKFIPDINDSFIATLANGVTMLLTHYSLPVQDRQGWAKSSLDYQ